MNIFEDITDLKDFLDLESEGVPTYITSGGFDPMHVGHRKDG